MKIISRLTLLLTILVLFVLSSCEFKPDIGIPEADSYFTLDDQPETVQYKVSTLPEINGSDIPSSILNEINSLFVSTSDVTIEKKHLYYNKTGKLVLSCTINERRDSEDPYKVKTTSIYKVSDDISIPSGYKWIRPGIQFKITNYELLEVNGKSFDTETEEFSEFMKFYTIYSVFKYEVQKDTAKEYTASSGVKFNYESLDISLEIQSIDGYTYYGNIIDSFEILSDFYGIDEIKKLSYWDGETDINKVIVITGGEYEGVYSIPEDI